MILIPEIEKIFIRIPRTGSGSVKKGILETYPKAMELYHHMEAAGIPRGYENWEVVSIIRAPDERMYSLYRYLQNVVGGIPAWQAEMRASVAGKSFEDWFINNETIFCQPEYQGVIYPRYSVIRKMPETKKTQTGYIAGPFIPTLFRHDNIEGCFRYLGIPNNRVNVSPDKGAFVPYSVRLHSVMIERFIDDLELYHSLSKPRNKELS